MPNNTHDLKTKERLKKLEKHDHWVEHFFRRVLHTIERCIAAITLLVLLVSLGLELYKSAPLPDTWLTAVHICTTC